MPAGFHKSVNNNGSEVPHFQAMRWNVLLVEDEVPAAVLLQKLLAIYCPHVRVVAETSSVPAAQAWVLSGAIDLVILDVELKDESTLSLLRFLCTQKPPIPCIVTSAIFDYRPLADE